VNCACCKPLSRMNLGLTVTRMTIFPFKLVARSVLCGMFVVSCLSLLLCSVAGGNTQPGFKRSETARRKLLTGRILTVSCLSLLLCSVAGGNTQPGFRKTSI
jgi:hypothetical protein